jgi:hypothetical protein
MDKTITSRSLLIMAVKSDESGFDIGVVLVVVLGGGIGSEITRHAEQTYIASFCES